MRPRNVRNPAGGRGSRALHRRQSREHPTPLHRSAQNWFLDAAICARDGDTASARAAALCGCLALERWSR